MCACLHRSSTTWDSASVCLISPSWRMPMSSQGMEHHTPKVSAFSGCHISWGSVFCSKKIKLPWLLMWWETWAPVLILVGIDFNDWVLLSSLGLSFFTCKTSVWMGYSQSHYNFEISIVVQPVSLRFDLVPLIFAPPPYCSLLPGEVTC